MGRAGEEIDAIVCRITRDGVLGPVASSDDRFYTDLSDVEHG
jgi:hypothetical protein